MDFCMVEFHDQRSGVSHDLQLPTTLTGEELVIALTKAYQLPIDLRDPNQVYLRSEAPIALIAGESTLAELNLSNGTRIYFDVR